MKSLVLKGFYLYFRKFIYYSAGFGGYYDCGLIYLIQGLFYIFGCWYYTFFCYTVVAESVVFKALLLAKVFVAIVFVDVVVVDGAYFF